MKKIRTLVFASTALIALESFAMQVQTNKTSTTTTSGTSGGCPGGVSDCSPAPTPTVPTPSKDTAFNIAPDAPTQFGVKDVEITADGQCRVGSDVGPYSKSPCEKIYGAKNATSSSSSSSSSSDTSYLLRSK